jgi:hypothetical protein
MEEEIVSNRERDLADDANFYKDMNHRKRRVCIYFERNQLLSKEV